MYVGGKSIIRGQKQIKMKMSMKDDIFRMNDIKFYVPNYPVDYIQRSIVQDNSFYEIGDLRTMDKFLPQNAVILDIGANIGNHTLYWLKESPKKAQYVYAFEVIDDTYKILKKNIELNNLQNKTTLFNFGLGDKNVKSSVRDYNIANVGGTSIKEDDEGSFELKRLDDIKIDRKVDVIKIDVEGYEVNVINGAKNFLKKHKPLIWVELWEEDGNGDKRFKVGNREQYNALMKELGYKMIYKISNTNFVYQYKN